MSAPSDLWKGRPVLVTGAAGFLGSWLVKALVEREAAVVALVRDQPPQASMLQRAWADSVTFVRGDVTDPSLCERVLAEYGVEVVFHLAAQSQVGVARINPSATFETNVRGTWTLLESCRRVATVRAVVVASSDKAYGPSDSLPYREEWALAGRFPYDVSKSCADLIARSYFHTYGLPVYVARCANLYGGGDLNFSRLVPHTVISALEGRPPRLRGSGLEQRDFLYVEDACSAYVMLAECGLQGRLAGEAFNFGIGEPRQVMEVVQSILRLAGRADLKPKVLNVAAAEIKDQWVDPAKARALLGWEPRWSLEAGLEATIAWYRSWRDATDRRGGH